MIHLRTSPAANQAYDALKAKVARMGAVFVGVTNAPTVQTTANELASLHIDIARLQVRIMQDLAAAEELALGDGVMQ